MSPRRRGLLVVDASALIDYLEADPTVIRLISDLIGQIHVPLPLLREEIHQLKEEDCGELGIIVVEPELELVTRAMAHRSAGLSFHDRICLLLAIQLGWTCVTNDGALRRACEEEGVPVLWGLETVALVVDAGGLTKAAAEEIGRDIQAANPRFITDRVLNAFLERVKRGRSAGRRKRKKGKS